MSRKIDIELTSARPDGSWTWRVVGAKQPKGVLDGAVLPPGSKVGDVLRAEAEFELEGTIINSVAPPPGKRPEPDRLELLSDARPFEGVTTSLVPKSGRPRRDRDDRGPRSDRPPRPGRPDGSAAPTRPDGPAGRPTTRDSEGRGSRPERGPRAPRPEGAGSAPGAGRDATRADGGSETSRPSTRRPEGRRPDPGRARGDSRPDQGARQGGDEGRRDRAPAGPPRPKRLSPANTHRNVVLESLAPEERAVAEQLLHGGIPAVRRAVQEQNVHAREEGRPEVKAEPLLELAEELLPRLKGAEWRDRADAAVKDADEIALRDLRSVVAGAEAGARDDESRILAKTLRDALDRREVAAREVWVAEITTCLDEGRVTRALRVAGRPPDPRTRFPADLITRLTEAASAAMGPDTPPDRWAALLSAVLESPVRRSVKPAGLPAAPSDALLAAARQASGRIPALAAMLGLQMPPPPGPPRPGARPPRPPSPPPTRRERPGSGPPRVAAAAAAPVVDAPAAIGAPVADAPPLEAPVVNAPVVDAAADAPVVDAPAAHVLPADAPAAVASVVDAPVVSTPPVDAPAVEASVVDAPVVSTLPLDAPAVVEAPVVDAPAADAPTVEPPIVDAPRADAPGSDAPPDGPPAVEAAELPQPADLEAASTTAVETSATTSVAAPVLDAPEVAEDTQATTPEPASPPPALTNGTSAGYPWIGTVRTDSAASEPRGEG